MIRSATNSDVPAVAQCAIEAYAGYVERIGRKPAPMVADFASIQAEGNLYVLEADQTIAGFIVFFAVAGAMHIENVAVPPIWHGKGYGSRLIAFAEAAARRKGLKTVELYTNEKMVENFGFYEARNYVEVDRRRQDGFNRVYFRKRL